MRALGRHGAVGASPPAAPLIWLETTSHSAALSNRELLAISSLLYIPNGRKYGMREKCQELEEKIERFRRVAASINDQLTIDRLNQLIKDTEAEQAALHLEQQK